MPENKIEKPPKEAGGMVSEEDLVEGIKAVKAGTKTLDEIEIPPKDVLTLFMVEKLHDINVNLGRIANAFDGAKTIVKKEPEPTQKSPVIDTGLRPLKTEPQEKLEPQAPETVESPVGEPRSSQVTEIIAAFESVKELVKIDADASAQFVLVYMNGYLQKPDFAKVAKIAGRGGFGGEYIKQGKRSHFKIPKMGAQPLQTKEPKREPKSGDPVGNAQMLFTQDLEELLNFTLDGKTVKIKPKKFLGSDNFAKIASAVRNAGGEYISAGEASHFIVPTQ